MKKPRIRDVKKEDLQHILKRNLLLTQEEDVIQKIKSGSIYEDALAWYTSKYIYPVHERSFWLLTILVLFLTLLSFSIFFMKINKDTYNPIIAVENDYKWDNATMYITDIRSDTNLTVHDSLIKHMVERYILNLENFTGTPTLKTINEHLQNTAIYASEEVDKYLEYRFSLFNPHNPLLKMLTGGEYKTTITNFEFLDYNKSWIDKLNGIFQQTELKPYKAKVKLRSTIKLAESLYQNQDHSTTHKGRNSYLGNSEAIEDIELEWTVVIYFDFVDAYNILDKTSKTNLAKFEDSQIFHLNVLKYEIINTPITK